MIVFLEKAMITGLPLQNKLRTYKEKKKKNVRAFFSQSGLDPPTAKPDENFLDSCMDIRSLATPPPIAYKYNKNKNLIFWYKPLELPTDFTLYFP